MAEVPAEGDVVTRCAPPCPGTGAGVGSGACVIRARILQWYVALGLRVGALIAVPGGRLRGRDGLMARDDALSDASIAAAAVQERLELFLEQFEEQKREEHKLLTGLVAELREIVAELKRTGHA